MRVLLLIAVTILSVQATFFSKEWTNFKVALGKTYSTLVEEHVRFQNFQNSLKIIAEHNALYDLGKISYKMGVNQFTDWTREEFLNYLTSSGPPPETESENTVVIRADPSQVQEVDFDWRIKGVVTGVKNQGQCGSCWSFSTTGSLEGAYAIRNKKLVSFSEQCLVDCDILANKGCKGGWVPTAFTYIEVMGIPTEESYSYTGTQGTCHNYTSITTVSYVSAISKNDEKALQYAVKNYGPVSVTIDASNLQYYSSGIFDDDQCSTIDLNHAVLVVGYGNENDQDYWIVKNSWGGSWGEYGYVKMSRNKNNQCGIAATACIPVL